MRSLTLFQSLIGWLQTESVSVPSPDSFEFQSLIGWLQTKVQHTILQHSAISFNPL